ncbi:gamma-glutamylcyclotransferase family protein [Thermospira aquatica]|uniref:Gamma-glutamylcyclotransferase family protein n=1 Tax=Thermospira aquatica TaxID=2828656 RepID=A0AAX3BBP9_9SPIR|nr:gamma-glutamylcyclotransferase family protein [Thermospira aquatica]URA09689.1 gamma-glutamylcyclotransferase [Thermospira aquatica]
MYLFVYGTLLKGEESHNLLENSPLIATGYVKGTLYDLHVGFPALNIEEIQGRVRGEVYEITNDLLSDLDRYEGCDPDDEDALYERKEILFYPDKGSPFSVWCYIMNERQLRRFSCTVISSGNWRKR